MKKQKIIQIIIILIATLFSFCSPQKHIKGIYTYQNDTLLAIQLFDSTGKIYFDKTTSIQEDWANKLFTIIIAQKYKQSKLIYEYKAKSNSGFSIKKYDYDQVGNLKGEYEKNYNPSDYSNINPYSYIYDINTPDSLINYLNLIIPDSLEFSKRNYFQRSSCDYFKEYTDSNGLRNKEYWTLEDSMVTNRIIEKYDANNRLISKYVKTSYNESLNNYKYDEYDNLIEELEIYDLESKNYQRKVHIYNNNLLNETSIFHGDFLAFKYKYFYADGLLIKKNNTRFTNSKHFQSRRWEEIFIYNYEFY
ncbi:MAG: hypothetical protein WAR79_15260 [Melioribacteraceae bacterium]